MKFLLHIAAVALAGLLSFAEDAVAEELSITFGLNNRGPFVRMSDGERSVYFDKHNPFGSYYTARTPPWQRPGQYPSAYWYPWPGAIPRNGYPTAGYYPAPYGYLPATKPGAYQALHDFYRQRYGRSPYSSARGYTPTPYGQIPPGLANPYYGFLPVPATAGTAFR